MRSKFPLVLAVLAVAGLGFSASQAMADSLNLSFSGNGVSINVNVGDIYARQPLPPRGKFPPKLYGYGPGKPFPPKYVEANYYDDYDGYDDVPPQWRHRKHSRFWSQQGGGYGDAVMLNPQPLPPKYKFHYVN